MQTYANWELLLIDDGSSDESLQVARQFTDSRIKLFSDGQKQHLPARLNQAIAMSKGKYFARMDGDDVAYPERLERQVDYLEQHPDVDLVGGWIVVFGRNGLPVGKRNFPETHAAICAKPIAGFPIAHPTYMGRLEWFRRYRYSNAAVTCQDQDLLLRSYRFSKFANIPEILLGYREERIDLAKKIYPARLVFAQSVFREFHWQGQVGLAVRGVIEQGLKAVIDTFAVSTGLNYKILRHRARPITPAERQSWERVWRMVNQAESDMPYASVTDAPIAQVEAVPTP